jgi:tRNA A37 methylthiotransferase MiaB
MKILLINPNRYKSPPVPPIGLEYLAASLEKQGHEPSIVDLTFSEEIYKDIDEAIGSFAPDIVGVTVRNIDAVLYHTNEFFLDEIKEIVTYIRSRYGLKVIIGGTGISVNPEATRQYLNADCAIVGPAEHVMSEVINTLKGAINYGKVIHGTFLTEQSCPRRSDLVDYRKYYDEGGVAGFETHKGCSSSCVYCLEARTHVSFKRTGDVIEEIRVLVEKGHDHFHLCDSEFNESLDYSLEFCSALKKSAMPMKWAVYMKPGNIDEQLMRLLKDTGVYLITLSVDSWKRGPEYRSQVEHFISTVKPFGIKLAVDFLTGFPYEDDDTAVRWLDLFRKAKPDSVGINTYIRLHIALRLTNIILKDIQLRDCLLGDIHDKTFIKPVFYNRIPTDKLVQLINGDPLFRVEGVERGVNYSRI